MKRSVRELAELIDARVMGDGTVEVSRVASLQSAAVGDLIFAEEEKNFALASQSLASAVIAGEFAAGAPVQGRYLSVRNLGWHSLARRVCSEQRGIMRLEFIRLPLCPLQFGPAQV